MINSRDLKQLHPIVQAKANTFVERCRQAGIDILITSTYRDHESQNALYAQGRTVNFVNRVKLNRCEITGTNHKALNI